MPRPAIDPAQVEYWATLARRHAAAGHGERSRLIAEAQAVNGLKSADAVYRRLREYGGYTHQRKRRADAGTMAVDKKTLETIAGMRREGGRESGQQLMSLALSVSIAEASGHSVPVSVSQIGRYLRAQRLDLASQANAEMFTEMRSLHPNHVHQIDPSLCILYYDRSGVQQMARQSEWYKNKPQNVAKIQSKVWRYVRTDHASSDIDVRYYVAAGESQALMFEFLLWTWGRQPQRISHGIPKILVWDKGSANTAYGIRCLLDALEVEHIPHAAERPNVKGQVEEGNRLVEMQFESRLRFEPCADVDALNRAAADWAKAFNANRIPRMDCTLKRPGADPLVRTDLWMLIRPEQIRELPPREVCEKLMEGRPQERTIRPNGLITYAHPSLGRSTRYNVRAIPELHRGDVVQVSPLLAWPEVDAGLIRLRWKGLDGQEHTWRLAPELELDAFGRPLSAPVWGESYHPPMKREAERQAEALDALAYPAPAGGSGLSQTTTSQSAADGAVGLKPDLQETATERARKARAKHVVPFEGKLNAVSHLSQIEHPTYLPRRGAEVAVVAPEDLIPPVPLVRALGRLRAAWGRPITRQESQWLAARYGQAIPEGELERLTATGCASGELRVASSE